LLRFIGNSDYASEMVKNAIKKSDEAADYTVKQLKRIIEELKSKNYVEFIKETKDEDCVVTIEKEIKIPTFSEQVGYRMSCDLISSATKDFIVSIIKTQSTSDSVLDITSVFDNEIGQAIIALILSFGLPQMKGLNIGSAEVFDKFSHEFALLSATKAGKKAVDALLEYFLPVIQQSLEVIENNQEINSETLEKVG